MSRNKFRYDISFLRVVAVISVVLYHYKIGGFTGGFIGVDIFFVISGFLMTKIILNGFGNDSFNIREFYIKRVVRIFPALLLMLIFFAGIVYFLIPTQFIEFEKSAFSSSLFFSNVYYFLNSGYFDSAAHNNFLLHTWSLSVEWQFYMIFPLLLLLFRRVYLTQRKTFNFLFYCLIGISFLAMILHNIKSNNFSFFMFYTRAWEMLIGGIAFLKQEQLGSFPTRIKKIVLPFLYLIIFICIYKIESSFGIWPSYITLVPVLSTTLILGLNHEYEFYKLSPLKYLGDISYSLYLYHWPLYVISFFLSLNISIFDRSLFLLGAFVLSVISFELIEKRNFQNSVKFILVSSLAIFAIFFGLSKSNPRFYFRDIGALVDGTSNYKYSEEAKKQFRLGYLHLRDNQAFSDFDTNRIHILENGRENVVLLGDSHAGMFAETMQNIVEIKQMNLIQITADGTYPMENSKGKVQGSKDYFNYVFRDYFPRNYQKISLVVIASNYFAYTKADVEDKLNYTLKYFDRLNIPVLFLGQTDLYNIDFPTYYNLEPRFATIFANGEQSYFTKQLPLFNDYLKIKLGKRYINLFDEKINKISDDYMPYIYDKNHLTYYGTEQYRGAISNYIK